jgi:hypothetical protein
MIDATAAATSSDGAPACSGSVRPRPLPERADDERDPSVAVLRVRRAGGLVRQRRKGPEPVSGLRAQPLLNRDVPALEDHVDVGTRCRRLDHALREVADDAVVFVV